MSVMVGRERKKSFLLHVVRYECDANDEIDCTKLRSAYSLLFLVMCAIRLGVRRRHICQRAISM